MCGYVARWCILLYVFDVLYIFCITVLFILYIYLLCFVLCLFCMLIFSTYVISNMLLCFHCSYILHWFWDCWFPLFKASPRTRGQVENFRELPPQIRKQPGMRDCIPLEVYWDSWQKLWEKQRESQCNCCVFSPCLQHGTLHRNWRLRLLARWMLKTVWTEWKWLLNSKSLALHDSKYLPLGCTCKFMVAHQGNMGYLRAGKSLSTRQAWWHDEWSCVAVRLVAGESEVKREGSGSKFCYHFWDRRIYGCAHIWKNLFRKVVVKLPPVWGRRIWRKSEVIWVKSQVCWISQLLAEGQFGEASYVASVQRLRLIKHIRNSFHQTYELLGGGFKYFLFSSLVGEDSHFDKYFSKGLKPPNLSIHFVSICLASLSWNCRFMFW